MTKRFKILFLIVVLGALIIPTQHFFAQTIDKCCTEASAMDCCEQKEEKTSHHQPCDTDHNDSNSCNDCSTCNTCHHTIISFAVTINGWQIDQVNYFTDKEFIYFSPEVSSVFSKIWQPPKIG